MIKLNLLRPKYEGHYVECDATNSANETIELFAFRIATEKPTYRFPYNGRYSVQEIKDCVIRPQL